MLIAVMLFVYMSGCYRTIAPISTTLPSKSQAVQPPQLLDYWPKDFELLPDSLIILYFDKKPTHVTAGFGDVAFRGDNVIITNVDLSKKTYIVTWKGGSIKLVFKVGRVGRKHSNAEIKNSSENRGRNRVYTRSQRYRDLYKFRNRIL